MIILLMIFSGIALVYCLAGIFIELVKIIFYLALIGIKLIGFTAFMLTVGAAIFCVEFL